MVFEVPMGYDSEFCLHIRWLRKW